MIRISLFAGVLAVALCGCASRTDSSLDGPVHYALQAFEGTKHTTLDIEPSGRVTRTVEPGPMTTFELDSATLAQVARQIDAVDFASLEAKYGCGGCTDDAVFTVSVTVDSHAYSVETESRLVPASMQPLLATLKSIGER